ncbi:MAG: hypothetical protein HKN73_08430 [Gemmatimonadetes bacterium]|nr:hypothetical protein [Gemmatimonadota bacterium]
MERPLWQIFLTMIIAAFGAVRAGGAAVVWAHEGLHPFVLSLSIQAGGGLLGALGIWIGGRWTRLGLLALGGGLTGGVLVGFAGGHLSLAAALGQIGAVVVGLGALAFLFKVASESDPDAA